MLRRWAVYAGFLCGLLGYGGVWEWTYADCTRPGFGGVWVARWPAWLPVGLGVPLSGQFVAEVGAGLFGLTLVCVLLRRLLPAFVRGLALALVPCALAFLSALSLLVTTPLAHGTG